MNLKNQTTMDTNRPIVTTGVESAKADEAPRRGACTSSAPGNPAANAAGSSAGAGLAVAKTAAKTKTKSQSKRRTPALHGTSTGPSSQAKASAPAMINTTASAPLPTHPPSLPVATQANSQAAGVTGQTGTVCTGDVFASSWKVIKGKRKGKDAPPQAHCSKVDPTGQPATTSQGKRRERLTRKERRQERRRGGKSKPPSNKQVADAGKLSFSAGERSAEAGTSRPTPDQSQTVAGGTARTATKTQQAARSGQAVAKRALNETVSPRGEHKRPRLDQSKRNASKSYAQAANASLSVAITCDRTGIISQEVSDQVIVAIQQQILDEACTATQDTPGPAFNAKPQYTGGVIKLWCSNDYTLAWLKKTVSGLALSASTSLVVKSQSEIQKRVRCGIAIPDDHGVYVDSSNIGRALSYQNPWVDVRRWVLIHAAKQDACWFVVLGVPEEQIPTLMSAERRLAIGLGSVYIKFQGANGRFVDVPRNWDHATKQVVEAEETAPPTSSPEATVADPAAAVESAAHDAAVDAVPSSGGELDDILLSPASGPGGDGFDEGSMFAGLRLDADEEGSACDGVPFASM